MYDKKLADFYGITEDQRKGKTDAQIIKMMKEASDVLFTKMEQESEKVYYENMEKVEKQVFELLKTPLEVYVGKVGAKTSKTTVPVIGYDFSTKSLITKFNDKIVSVEEKYFIRKEADIETVAALVKKEKEAAKGTGKGKTQKD
ncbi:hypothetical protein FACS189445_6260 [Spirochaetia bacterium]|nr:hypothetical protein FACS189445_6260 [Spirochaetia bacterium]